MSLTAFRKLGQQADRRLAEHGFTLTQGGEPTFVPTNPAAPEWNTAAIGSEKLDCTMHLCSKMIPTLFPGGVPIKSMGKHYPGEPIPRWSLALYRTKTGTPLWKNRSLVDLKLRDHSITHSPKLPAQWLSKIAEHLKIKPHLLSAYENPELAARAAYEQGKTSPWPRFNPHTRNFEIPKLTPDEAQIWNAFGIPKGAVLPLTDLDGVWKTNRWDLFQDRPLLLIPGDSAIGLRLPLSQLPPTTLRTALTAELREGLPVLFLPPLSDPKSVIALVHAIETATEALGLRTILIEGYPPPMGDLLESFQFSPDPGVIEVNLPPSATWNLLETRIQALFKAANASDLVGYKYQFTGRKSGTGGGAHIVLGGATHDTNPFLQRPTLLSSFLRFFHNHPSLSYLFAGLNVGPSSQSPRADESIGHLLSDFELALRQVEQSPIPADPAMIDGVLRHYILDLHGNTHRAEISIDKFWNPFQPNGRLGLVEFRAIEMMPTAPMLLGLNALLRALAAAFVQRPYRKPLHDWKSEKLDRLSLPYFLEKDFQEVVLFLKQAGFSLEAEAFHPHIDFRYPKLLETKITGTDWTLRRALECWPVLGEEPSGSFTSRWMDSSTDRLELSLKHASGLSKVRVAINGIDIPFRKTSEGAAVFGIRYRMFSLHRMLHPQIPSHAPLLLDFYDPKRHVILESVRIHPWTLNPDGYPGLPTTEREARKRQKELLIHLPERKGLPFRPEKMRSKTPWKWVLDLHWV